MIEAIKKTTEETIEQVNAPDTLDTLKTKVAEITQKMLEIGEEMLQLREIEMFKDDTSEERKKEITKRLLELGSKRFKLDNELGPITGEINKIKKEMKEVSETIKFIKSLFSDLYFLYQNKK